MSHLFKAAWSLKSRVWKEKCPVEVLMFNKEEMLEKRSKKVSVINECKVKKRVYTGLNAAQTGQKTQGKAASLQSGQLWS